MSLARCCALVLLSALFRPALAQEVSRHGALAFTGAGVIDATTREVRSNQTVVVRDRRIVAVGADGSIPVPADARVVDARGKFLIPGLWDMHVHTDVPAGRSLLAFYVANGVTGVRDMAGEWERLSGWRREIAAGALIGPRIIASGPYLEGGDIPIPHLLVRAPADAAPAVDSLARLGVDFVKVHGQLTRESYFAIARAVRARGLTFGGHIPRGVTAAEASDSGQKSLEHLLAIPNRCTTAEAKQLAPRHPLQGFLGQCTPDDMTPLFARLVRNGTWIVPTLVAAVEIAMLPSRELPSDTLAHFLPDTLKRYVQQIFQLPTLPPGADSVGRALFAKRVEVVGAMHRAGVQLMTGTDAPVRNSPPGFSIHEELSLFVDAGLTPWEALRAATLHPARFFGVADSSGTIEPGKVADLVLLEANPLADIRNTRRISLVVANGRPYRPECLLPSAVNRAGTCE